MTAIIITLSAFWVAAIAGLLSPVAVAVSTHLKASARVKRTVGAAVAVIVGYIAQHTTATGDAIIDGDAIIASIEAAVTVFAIQQGSYAAFLKRLHLNEHSAPNRGIGKPST